MSKTEQKNNVNSKIQPKKKGEKLLLHACCGPCSLEPYRILKEQGWEITIFYSNDNIFPEEEFYKRWNELEKWASSNNIKVVKDYYDNQNWQNSVGKMPESKQNTKSRKTRCGACYFLRLEKAAKYAKDNDIKYISSTLAVSPYQYNDILEEKLKQISDKHSLKYVFFDFRPYYSKATKKSIELNMYRQKYCGCEFSLNESIEQQTNLLKIKEQKKIKHEKELLEAKIKNEKIKIHQLKKKKQKELIKQYKNSNKNNS